MAMQNLCESKLDPANAVFDHCLPAGEPWFHTILRGQTLRIIDLEGNQAVDTIFYNADDSAERYSITDTMQHQGGIYLGTGSVLRSNRGQPLMTIVADTCGRHDTLGGACAAESNTVRYAMQKKFMHNCRDNYMIALAHADVGMGKRDIVPNINFFMNVPVTEEGTLTFEDGISAPGKYVELRADANVFVLVSNCPQLNNPCNAYNPTPVRFLVWDAQD
jgi:urea carboxylase-associated protein 1